jgi:DNA-binding transcriptional ArsR family regulator
VTQLPAEPDGHGPPAERDEEAVGRFLERFASVLVEAGMPPMPSRAFAALLVTDSGRLTAVDLATLLAASPASISGAVRYLEQLGMIRREREPGSRRDVYLILDDIWYEVAIRRDQVLTRWVSAARDGIGLLGPQTRAGQRMADSLDFFAFLLEEMPAMLGRWQEHKNRREAAPATLPPAAERQR